MPASPVRPEDSKHRSDPQPVWPDTVPALFRSEAFAEDLVEPPASIAPAPPRRAAHARPRFELALAWALRSR